MPLNRMTKLSWIYDLYRLGQDAVQAGNISDIYQQILAHIVEGFDAKSGSLALCGNDVNGLTIVAGIDLPTGVVGSKVAMGEGVLGWAVKENKALLLNGDVSNDPRFHLRNSEGHGSTATNSAICWPLRIEERTIGGISVNRSGGMPPFSEADMEQGTALLGMVSLALVNMQLHIEQKRRNDLLQSIVENVPARIFWKDRYSRFLGCNTQFAKDAGLSRPDELIGKTDFDMGWKDQAELYRADDMAVMESGNAKLDYEEPQTALDGNIIWLCTSKVPLRDGSNQPFGILGIYQDITVRKQTEEKLRKYNEELEAANHQLGDMQNLLLQSEKMSAIGQLAAGVAHEINNPIGYVHSNLGTLEKYVQDVFSMLDSYGQVEGAIADEAVRSRLQAARKKLDIDFLKEDLHALMEESRDGITRVKNIVQNLKDFSHVDASDEWHFADLHNGIDSTLNIVNNEIKYKANVLKEYGALPEVECLSSQLNQVFMNLLVNAAHAIEERGTITIRTGQQGEEVWVEIADTGKGIPPENMKKIFDPFFTTKPIGKGTGLGLSLSYGIIHKHHGRIEVQSEMGKGTTFRVWLPVKHADSPSPERKKGSALLPCAQDFSIERS